MDFPLPLQYFLLGVPFGHTAPEHPFGKLGFWFFDIESGIIEQSEVERKVVQKIQDGGEKNTCSESI